MPAPEAAGEFRWEVACFSYGALCFGVKRSLVFQGFSDQLLNPFKLEGLGLDARGVLNLCPKDADDAVKQGLEYKLH